MNILFILFYFILQFGVYKDDNDQTNYTGYKLIFTIMVMKNTNIIQIYLRLKNKKKKFILRKIREFELKFVGSHWTKLLIN